MQRSAISKYETGTVPLTTDTLIKLSEIFEVSVDYILGITRLPRYDRQYNYDDIFYTQYNLADNEQKYFEAFLKLSAHEKEPIFSYIDSLIIEKDTLQNIENNVEKYRQALIDEAKNSGKLTAKIKADDLEKYTKAKTQNNKK